MRARPPVRNGSVAAALLAGVCALATGKVAEAQATCQGSLATSSPSAPALVKYIPAATRSGVVFHAWLDTNRTPSAGHLVVENTNPYPVAVRFDAELWGAAGTVAGGSRCVWLRPREFAVAVQEYPAGTLSAVRVRDAEVGRIEPPPVRLTGLVPPRASRPRTRAAEPETSRLATDPSPREEPSPPARSETSPTTPPRRRDTAEATRRETSRPSSARVRDTAASTPRRERRSSTQVARRDTAARPAAPRRETSSPTARRETAARAREARRDSAPRITPRRDTRAPTARREASSEAPAPRRITVAQATKPRRETTSPATRRKTSPPTWTTLGDTPIASTSRAVPPSRATRRDTTLRAPAPRVATAAPDTSSRAASASDPLARTPNAADSAGTAAMTTRVAAEPADSPLSGAPEIAPRPAPSRSPEGETAESYPNAESGVVPGTAGRADTARSVKLREDAPPLAKTGTTVFSVAFAALMVPAGIVLLMAIGGVAWLLAASALRRAWPGRRRD